MSYVYNNNNTKGCNEIASSHEYIVSKMKGSTSEPFHLVDPRYPSQSLGRSVKQRSEVGQSFADKLDESLG